MRTTVLRWTLTSVFVLSLSEVFAADTGVRHCTFDSDPGWEGYNNHIVPRKLAAVTQDFGYVAPGAAGEPNGAIGGKITRAAKPAFYAVKLSRLTLNNKFQASGDFRLTKSTGNSGVFFGWFNGQQPGGSGRPINSLGFDFDGENSGGRLAVRMINSRNKSCGSFVTPFIPGKYRPTPIRNDGTRYHWKVEYNPTASSGKGQFTFSIRSDGAGHEDFEGKVFTVDLPDGFKAENASLDHFGVMNMMKGGGFMNLYFSNLQLDDAPIELKTEPSWEGRGNRATYQDPDPVGAHDFGWSGETSYAGGKPGEIGGKFWRTGNFAYYAERVGALGLERKLEASGKVVLLVGAPDSDMCFGWFNSGSTNHLPADAHDFVGVHIGGPTRIGHYFSPRIATREGHVGRLKTAPVLTPGKVCDWTLIYDPDANGGDGEVRLTLGREAAKMALHKGEKKEGAILDRFGLFTSTIGGQMVRVYFDDVSFTAGR